LCVPLIEEHEPQHCTRVNAGLGLRDEDYRHCWPTSSKTRFWKSTSHHSSAPTSCTSPRRSLVCIIVRYPRSTACMPDPVKPPLREREQLAGTPIPMIQCQCCRTLLRSAFPNRSATYLSFPRGIFSLSRAVLLELMNPRSRPGGLTDSPSTKPNHQTHSTKGREIGRGLQTAIGQLVGIPIYLTPVGVCPPGGRQWRVDWGGS